MPGLLWRHGIASCAGLRAQIKLRAASLEGIVLALACASTAQAKGPTKANDIKGQYGFSFEGQVLGVGEVIGNGVFTADGKGNITDGARTVHIAGDMPFVIEQTFTCEYTVAPNGTGSADCEVTPPLPGIPVESYAGVLVDKNREIRYVSTTPGIFFTANARRQ